MKWGMENAIWGAETEAMWRVHLRVIQIRYHRDTGYCSGHIAEECSQWRSDVQYEDITLSYRVTLAYDIPHCNTTIIMIYPYAFPVNHTNNTAPMTAIGRYLTGTYLWQTSILLYLCWRMNETFVSPIKCACHHWYLSTRNAVCQLLIIMTNNPWNCFPRIF